MFLPSTLYIKPQSAHDSATVEITRRVQALDPTIPIVPLTNNRIPIPQALTPVDRWRQRKKTLVLAHRTTPFLTTFASPGKIVEDMGVLLNMSWQCPSNCSFCYLQNVLPPDHMLYTNLDQLQREVSIEPYVHRSVLTLWTIISFVKSEELTRIPENFHKAADYIRSRFQKEKVSKDSEAIELLDSILRAASGRLFKILGGETVNDRRETDKGKRAQIAKTRIRDLGFSSRSLRVPRRRLVYYYKRNSKFPIRLNASEFTDVIAFDQISGYSNTLMQLVGRNPNIELNLRTKSAFVDELVAHDGHNRVRFAMNFNTPYVIDHYEKGTALLEERLSAARKVQDARGFRLKIVIEPIIKYVGYEDDYVALADRIMKAVDPNKLEDISIGFVRYSGRLEARVKRNFPYTDLFNDQQGLLPLVKGDRRRYPLEERVRVYRMVLDEFRKHSKVYLRLAGETPETWDLLGLRRRSHIDRSVYQYPG